MLDLPLQDWHNRFMANTFTDASCPTCETYFDRLPVEWDEDGGYAFLPVRPCASCAALLCACCDQFHCDGCGMTFCADHLVSVEDGTETPLHCCVACAAECEQYDLPMAIPPQSETRPVRTILEVA